MGNREVTIIDHLRSTTLTSLYYKIIRRLTTLTVEITRRFSYMDKGSERYKRHKNLLKELRTIERLLLDKWGYFIKIKSNQEKISDLNLLQDLKLELRSIHEDLPLM
jgi:hypothetical protein